MSFKVASSPNQLGFCVISPSNSTPHSRPPSMDKKVLHTGLGQSSLFWPSGLG